MRLAVMLGSVLLLCAAKPQDKTFYVYQDKGSMVNHFIPSGWMGDYGDIKISEASTENPVDGKTAFKVTYTAEAKQGANWAGIYWQNPPNNWGNKPNGGFDLTKYKRLTFWARGEKGGETIAEFIVGGISGDYMDSDKVSIGPITLTKEWKKYTINLKDHDMRNISGGFCWSASKDDNPKGFTFWLDEVRFES